MRTLGPQKAELLIKPDAPACLLRLHTGVNARSCTELLRAVTLLHCCLSVSFQERQNPDGFPLLPRPVERSLYGHR